jgi:menaquinone reductase, molybdopterin-binding-like subunit
MKMHRRDFVRFITGGVAGAAASGASLYAINRFAASGRPEEVRVPGGPEQWHLSVCSQCEAGCGLRVRTVGQRVVKIQGNPLHPASRGGLCPKGLAGLQILYHPDRLRSPLRNAGTRQTPRWREISWEEAVPLVTSRLRELRDSGRAHTVALIDRSRRDLSSRLFQRFLAAYGSPNYLTMPSGLDAFQTAISLQQGVAEPVAFDLENSRYVLSFGVNLLEGWGSPAVVMRAFGRWRDAAAGRRSKLVQIEPRLSVTAAKSDEWIALRPGTEATLALGIAYVLITEELYDTAFVREHTFGFDDWKDAGGRPHTGFRSLVLGDYRLDDVVAATGVPADKILRIAREFAANRPAVAIGDRQTSTLCGDPYAAMAVHSLNALVGGIESAGGVFIQPELPFPGVERVSQRRLDEGSAYPVVVSHLARLPEAILSRQPYPVNAVLLNEVDPVFALAEGDQLRRALREVPFVASFTPFFNESAALADVILPTATGLEKWQATTTPPLFPRPLVTLSPPVIPPRHRTRDGADIILEVSRGLRGAVAQALPFASVEQYLKHSVGELFAAQRGSVFGTGFDETWDRLLDRSGWWAPSFSNAEELWKQMQESGGWWDPGNPSPDWQRALRTSTGRFEFYSRALADRARPHPGFARAAGLKENDDRLFLPHQSPLEPARKDEFLLLPIEVLPLARGEGAHVPYLQQIAAANLNSAWDSWLEIHPESARKLGITDGDSVWIESRRAHARVRVRVYEGVEAGVVHLPLGYGHIEGSPWSRCGTNPLRLIEPQYEPVAGLPRLWGTYVKIVKS